MARRELLEVPSGGGTARADVLAVLTRGLVEGGFACLDRGDPLELVSGAVDSAVQALMAASDPGARTA